MATQGQAGKEQDTVTYISIQCNGFLHVKKPGERKTVCGRDYTRYDYMSVREDEFDSRYHSVCYKCQNKRREGSRTIKAAFGKPGKALG